MHVGAMPEYCSRPVVRNSIYKLLYEVVVRGIIIPHSPRDLAPGQLASLSIAPSSPC